MTQTSELDREEAWFRQLLRWGPRNTLPPGGGTICQACGEVGYFEDHCGEIAGHSEHGDFLGFTSGHRRCRELPRPRFVSRRGWRYCEVCRKHVDANGGIREADTWACSSCAALVETAGHDLGELLSDLAFRRFCARSRYEPRPDEPGEQLDLLAVQPGTPPQLASLPEGLKVCPECDRVRGHTFRAACDGSIFDAKSTCFCEGLTCKVCGQRRIPRPISDYFSPEEPGWWHVPYFVGMARSCGRCNEDGGCGDAF